MKTLFYMIMFVLIALVIFNEHQNSEPSSESKAYGQMISQTQNPEIKLDSVKAAILEKVHIPKTKSSDEQFLMVYKNVDGEIWKIENSLPFWGAGEKNDSVWVYFSNVNRKNGYVSYSDVKPMK